MHSLMLRGSSLEILKKCGGCYESPTDSNGKLLGPLVAYAGKYETEDGGKQWVGSDYFNFAMAEQDPDVRDYFAGIIAGKIFSAEMGLLPTVVVGMPMGGILLATELGRILGCRTIFAEKKIIALADPAKGLKEVSELIIERHEIRPNDNAFIVEDVCNNFSTTQKAFALIAGRRAKFIGINCAVNRSDKEEWSGYPVISAIFKPSKQYRQDDPIVASLIAEGEIVWKPKQEWSVLKAAMEGK